MAYHAYQSFLPDEVTPELCHQIGVELAQSLWGSRYQVVVATHLDREHLHNHFLINSVSPVDGKKFNDSFKTYYAMREMSDKLCHAYQLSTIKNPQGHTPRAIYYAEKNGDPTRYNLMREALDIALECSLSIQDFHKILLHLGYRLDDNPNHKYWTLCEESRKKPVRLFRLGEKYSQESILQVLEKNQSHSWEIPYYPIRSYRIPRIRYNGAFRTTKRYGGILGLYMRYCYLLGVYPKRNPNPKPLSPELKQAIKGIDQISEQVRIICREKIKTVSDIDRFIDKRIGNIQTLTQERKKCYNRLRRCTDPEQRCQIKLERDHLTELITVCREEIATATKIQTHSDVYLNRIKGEEKMRLQRIKTQPYRQRHDGYSR